MDITTILIKPILTEKSYFQSLGERKKYYFQVDLKANKASIRQAFRAIYGINPLKVNVKRLKSARAKKGTAHPGRTKAQKVAIITLAPGVEILVTGQKPDEAQKKE